MKKLRSLLPMLFGGVLGVLLPLGIEYLILTLSGARTWEVASKSFLFYFLIAMAAGIMSGRTIVWLKENKNDSRIATAITFTVIFIGFNAIRFALTSEPTYLMGATVTILFALGSFIVNAERVLPWPVTRKSRG